jgi:hypothetical protein
MIFRTTLVMVTLVLASCTGSGGREPAGTSDGGMDGAVGFCSVASDCDDGVACTVDTCEERLGGNNRCTREQSPSLCSPGFTCDLLRGCIPGRVCAVDDDCADEDPCTTRERCDSASRVCTSLPLDGDGDERPAIVCGGNDCDDGNSRVYPGATEFCNEIDDNCNDRVDEAPACWAIQDAGPDCGAGFAPNDAEMCEDIDECAAGRCDPNADCTNSEGSYLCQCRGPEWRDRGDRVCVRVETMRYIVRYSGPRTISVATVSLYPSATCESLRESYSTVSPAYEATTVLSREELIRGFTAGRAFVLRAQGRDAGGNLVAESCITFVDYDGYDTVPRELLLVDVDAMDGGIADGGVGDAASDLGADAGADAATCLPSGEPSWVAIPGDIATRSDDFIGSNNAVMDSIGRLHVSWVEDWSVLPGRRYVSTYNGTEWTRHPEVTVAGATNIASEHALGVTADDEVVIALSARVADQWGLHVMRLRGSTWSRLGDPVNATGAFARSQQLALSASGDVVMVWEESLSIYGATWNGTSWTQLPGRIETHAGTGGAFNPKLAMRGDTPVVYWTQRDNTAGSWLVSSFVSEFRAGAWEQVGGRVTGPSDAFVQGAMAVAPDDTVYLATTTDHRTIRLRRFNGSATWVTVGDPVVEMTEPTAFAGYLSLAHLNGNPTVSFLSSPSSTSAYSTRIVTLMGTTWMNLDAGSAIIEAGGSAWGNTIPSLLPGGCDRPLVLVRFALRDSTTRTLNAYAWGAP